MNKKAQEARETKIYFLESYNEVYRQRFIGKDSEGKSTFLTSDSDLSKYTRVKQLSSQFVSCDYRIAETDLLSFVYDSAEETTSPRGVERKLYILEVEGETENVYELRLWGPNGHGTTLIDTFDTEEEAEDEAFNRTYTYDFLTDDQRDTWYSESREDAEQYLVERYADAWNVSEDVVESILSKRDRVEVSRAQKAEAAKLASEKSIAEGLAKYTSLIEKIEGEKYKDTAARLSLAIGQRIDSAVFHAAVKQIRK